MIKNPFEECALELEALCKKTCEQLRKAGSLVDTFNNLGDDLRDTHVFHLEPKERTVVADESSIRFLQLKSKISATEATVAKLEAVIADKSTSAAERTRANHSLKNYRGHLTRWRREFALYSPKSHKENLGVNIAEKAQRWSNSKLQK